jgi:hypothetical protein
MSFLNPRLHKKQQQQQQTTIGVAGLAGSDRLHFSGPFALLGFEARTRSRQTEFELKTASVLRVEYVYLFVCLSVIWFWLRVYLLDGTHKLARGWSLRCLPNRALQQF